MLNSLWKTLVAWASAHPMLAAILLSTMVAGALSSVWYAVRKAVWPGVETARLPTWARLVQALVELLANVPGALRALASMPSTPPGTPQREPAPTAPPHLVEQALRALGQGGTPPGATLRVTTVPPPPAALVLLALVGLGAALEGCGPARDALTSTVPGAPDPSGCAPAGASRCSGAMPEVCSSSGRWWSALPGPCPGGCVVEDAGARCSASDAGVSP